MSTENCKLMGWQTTNREKISQVRCSIFLDIEDE